MNLHDFIGSPGQRLAREGLHAGSPLQPTIMKLLYCRHCGDVFGLREQLRRCVCGQSWGQYLDRLNAEYGGEHAVMLGISNPMFHSALHDQRTVGDQVDGRGRRFDAFVIPDGAPTVARKP